MRLHGRFWGGGSVWWSHFLTDFVLYPFIMCGSYPISEGCILLATLSWVTGEKILTASCVNISYVFMTPPGDWFPAVERGLWEIRTLVSDLPGSILYSPLRWEFTLCSILSFVYCWQSSDLSLDMEREFWEFFFFFFDNAWLSELWSCYGLKINLIWQSIWSKDFVILGDPCPSSEVLKPFRVGEGDQGMVI